MEWIINVNRFGKYISTKYKLEIHKHKIPANTHYTTGQNVRTFIEMVREELQFNFDIGRAAQLQEFSMSAYPTFTSVLGVGVTGAIIIDVVNQPWFIASPSQNYNKNMRHSHCVLLLFTVELILLCYCCCAYVRAYV